MRIQPLEQHHRRMLITQRDRSLLKMVLSEVVVYVLTMSSYPIILSEVTITNNLNVTKSADYKNIENFLLSISTFLGYVNSAAPFYIFLIQCMFLIRTRLSIISIVSYIAQPFFDIKKLFLYFGQEENPTNRSMKKLINYL